MRYKVICLQNVYKIYFQYTHFLKKFEPGPFSLFHTFFITDPREKVLDENIDAEFVSTMGHGFSVLMNKEREM